MLIFNLKMTIFCFKKNIFNFKMRELSPKTTIIAQNGPKLPNSNRKSKINQTLSLWCYHL